MLVGYKEYLPNNIIEWVFFHIRNNSLKALEDKHKSRVLVSAHFVSLPYLVII